MGSPRAIRARYRRLRAEADAERRRLRRRCRRRIRARSCAVGWAACSKGSPDIYKVGPSPGASRRPLPTGRGIGWNPRGVLDAPQHPNRQRLAVVARWPRMAGRWTLRKRHNQCASSRPSNCTRTLPAKSQLQSPADTRMRPYALSRW